MISMAKDKITQQEYWEKDLKLRKQELKWTKFQSIMITVLTIIIAMITVMNFQLQNRGWEGLVGMIALAFIVFYFLGKINKVMK